VLREGLLETDGYFLQNQDALGKLGASTDQKMVCALRLLAHGVPADRFRCSCFPFAGEAAIVGRCGARVFYRPEQCSCSSYVDDSSCLISDYLAFFILHHFFAS
jgi:hypothetical protein